MKGFIQNRSGLAVIWFLLFVPVLLAANMYLITHTQAITGSDIDLQKALNNAARAAAMQVTGDSQAAGEPRINTEKAHAVFRGKLSNNLGLDAAALTPLEGSMVSHLDYVLLVYNGDSKYKDAETAKKFTFRDGSLSETNISTSGLPKIFSVEENDISLGSGGTIEAQLKSPGVIAVAKAKLKKVSSKKDIEVIRWIQARIVTYSHE